MGLIDEVTSQGILLQTCEVIMWRIDEVILFGIWAV
jgi:hypothetical protein